MSVHSDPTSTKPAIVGSNPTGRTTSRKKTEKATFWPPKPAEIARFALSIDASAGPNACHPWQGRRDRDGYGVFCFRGVPVGAHRFALQLKLGRELGPDEVTRHANTCTTRACCNDRHLTDGAVVDNIRDREESGRTQKGDRHYHAKLTADAVVTIRANASGESQTGIARSLGVGRKCIEHIVHSRNWKHVAAITHISIPEARQLFGVAGLMEVA